MSKQILILSILALITTLVSAKEVVHTVIAGETLSSILSMRQLRPIYGQNGHLKKTLDLNPKLKNDGNLIFPGQKILLSAASEVIRRTEKIEKIKTSEPVDPRTELSLASNSPPEFKEEPSASKSNVAHMKFDISLGVNFFRIDGRDNLLMGNATILSEASPNLALGMTLDWDEQNQLRTEINYQKYKLQDLNDGRRFTDNSDDQVALSLMYYRKITSRLTLGLGAKFSEELFFRAVSLNEITVNQVFILKPTVSFKYDYFQKDNAGIGLYGDLSYLSSGKTAFYDVKSGTGSEIGGYYYYNSLKKPLRGILAQAGYNYEIQNTSVVSQKKNGLNFKFGYQWGLDW